MTQDTSGSRPVLLSVVTPAFNEVDNLPLLYDRLAAALSDPKVEWEWIIVDDHSRDRTFEVIAELAKGDRKVRGLRLARNAGSHAAIVCGVEQAAGQCLAVIAADLQDPPEVLPKLLERWRAGSQVVWAVRQERRGETKATIWSARVYYWVMRHLVGLKQMPAAGADFFLLDRKVAATLSQFHESNVSVLALLSWMGFRQDTVDYIKEARAHGRSGWTFRRKVKLFIDSVTAFSYLPIRLITCVGFIVALMGFFYAAVVLTNAVLGHPIEGWTSLMVVVLIIGGVQMLMMGVLGEYLWRSFDESRKRPRFLIEATTETLLDDEATAKR